jgi:hypothetical protein
MQTSVGAELRQLITRYVANQLRLADLRRQTGLIVWSIEEAHDPAAEELAYDLELLLAEFDHGDLTPNTLRRELAERVLPHAPNSIAKPRTSANTTLTKLKGQIKFTLSGPPQRHVVAA